MRLVAAVVILLAATSCTCRHRAAPVFQYYDPMAVDASTVDELHHQRIRAVCTVGADRPEVMLQLCRDKGFDRVAFAPQVVSVGLLKQADRLGLAVVSAPSDSAGTRTTSGS